MNKSKNIEVVSIHKCEFSEVPNILQKHGIFNNIDKRDVPKIIFECDEIWGGFFFSTIEYRFTMNSSLSPFEKVEFSLFGGIDKVYCIYLAYVDNKYLRNHIIIRFDCTYFTLYESLKYIIENVMEFIL